MTSNPWAIVNKDQKSRNNNKNLFGNYLQNLSSVTKTEKVPGNASTLIVFAIHAVRMISVTGLKLPLFRSWADK